MPRFRLTRSPLLRPELPSVDDPDLPAPSARSPSPDPGHRRAPSDDMHHVDDAHHDDDTRHVAELRRAAQGVRVIARGGG